MPNINGKKINQLDDGKAVIDPLFVLGDQDGKAYNMGAQDLKTRLAAITGNSTVISSGTNLNTLTTPGMYALDKTIFKAGGYVNSPFRIKQGIFMPANALLIVEQLFDRTIQRIIWPGGKYTTINRNHGVPLNPRNNNTAGGDWSAWEISEGVIQLNMYYDSNIGGLATDSINSLDDYDVAGIYEIYPWKLNADGSNTFYTPTDQMYADRNFPSLGKYKAGMKYNGYITLKITNTYTPGGASNYRQSLYNQYSSAEPWIYYGLPYEMIRDGRWTGSAGDFGPWYPNSNQTIRTVGLSALGTVDNTLPAGTADLPPLVFTPGVQKQNPVVKNSFNTDGTNLFFTNNAGVTYKIDMTAV